MWQLQVHAQDEALLSRHCSDLPPWPWSQFCHWSLLLLSGRGLLGARTLTLSPGKSFLAQYPLWPYLKCVLENVCSLRGRMKMGLSRLPWQYNFLKSL